MVIACIIAKPINLTDEEIFYYTNTTEKVWYEGLHSVKEDDSIHVTFNLSEKKYRSYIQKIYINQFFVNTYNKNR